MQEMDPVDDQQRIQRVSRVLPGVVSLFISPAIAHGNS
jgi:hypothetical protein